MKIEEMKQEIERLLGCSTPNFLRMQFPELSGLKANTKDFWVRALRLAEDYDRHNDKSAKQEQIVLKESFSSEERERIARVLNRDNFDSTNIQPEDITRAFIINDMYHFYYREGGIELMQPIHSADYKRMAEETEPTESVIQIVDEQEAELITQYAGIWVYPEIVVGKKVDRAANKVYYSIKVSYSNNPMRVTMSLDYYRENIKSIVPVNRHKLIENMLNNLTSNQKEVVEQIEKEIK